MIKRTKTIVNFLLIKTPLQRFNEELSPCKKVFVMSILRTVLGKFGKKGGFFDKKGA